MKIKELTEKKNDLITRAEEKLNQAKEEKRELTEEEMAELTEIRDNVSRIDKEIDLREDLEKMDKKEKPMEEKVLADKEQEKVVEEQETRAFEDYVRGVVSHERTNNLTPATGSGAALIPTTIANRIIKKVYDISPILARSTRYNVKIL